MLCNKNILQRIDRTQKYDLTNIMTDTVRMAFLGDTLATWTGGIDFLRICINGIDATVSNNELFILFPKKALHQRARSLLGTIKRRLKTAAGRGITNIPRVSMQDFEDAMKNVGPQINIIDCLNSPAGLAKAMRQSKSNVLFPCTKPLRESFPYGWIGYIPDLQHKRLPQFFSKKECQQRDRAFNELLTDARAVVVNSKAVAQDIDLFYPGHRARIFSLPFCPSFASNPDSAFAEIAKAYRIPDKYFMISNQFWVHKSHETAFKALGLVCGAGHDVHIVCTGNMHDYRSPNHFYKLKSIIADKHLENKIHLLSVVPKSDQLAIMRNSVAVIQPTLFEGGPGGGSVYDAVSTCTPAIVSDINVNREIDIGVIEFFKTGSVEDLAEKMVKMLINPPHRMDLHENFRILSKRQQEFGVCLLEAARYAIEKVL
jgi:glycosyltransferase involved in cell wall biosynthesis